ncbi:MAG: ribonuclease T [Legionella sp.]|nr:MAG: ribonuclease T [Legionella sp.]PJD97459.1 MAG: ribonuclease T [Legionella sp.]
MSTNKIILSKRIKERFRGFLPVVIDVETAGVDPRKNALLEIGLAFIAMDDQGLLYRKESFFEHVIPFPGALLDQKSLDFIQVDPFQPLRFAIEEKEALDRLFKNIRAELKKTQCQRAVLVGHNAWFDLLFLNEAIHRTGATSPFHSFTCFDTATLAGLIYGQTVLAKAVHAAGLHFNANEAHSALYDAEITADLFCIMANQWRNVIR